MPHDWEGLITVQDVLSLHEKGILEHNQSPIATGLAASECVEGRLGNAWMAERYTSPDEDVLPGLCFAAYTLYYLVRDHCFSDGNKRAGWAACMAILAVRGLTVRSSTDDAYTLVERIATGAIAGGLEVLGWLSDRLEAPEDFVWT